jgi:hypothetical protein
MKKAFFLRQKKLVKKLTIMLSMVVHICNPSIWEAEAGGWQVGGQPGLHSEILPQKKS